MGLIFQDKEGNKISLDDYIELIKNPHYKIISQEIVGDKFVSTVWLGIPHIGNGSLDDEFYFETMVFQGIHVADGESLAMYRYKTKEDAEKGHKCVVEAVKNKKLEN